jgi:hypothetical protein
MSAVAVYSYTQSVVYVADNLLRSLKDIIRLSGLDPSKLTGDWEVLLRGISTWIDSGHLEKVVLEIYDPKTDALITRWDLAISYSWDISAGVAWTDPDQLKYAIRKAGLVPSAASYRVIVTNSNAYPSVAGWSSGTLRSTSGLVQQSIGATISHNGLSANTTYWRK